MTAAVDTVHISANEQIMEHAYDARGGVGRLRRVWPWLGDARLPGRPAPHLMIERRMSADAERIEAEQVRRDRRAKHLALRAGRTTLAPYAAPVRLGPIRTRARIAAQLRTIGIRLGAWPGDELADPTLDAPRRTCSWCAGAGRVLRPAAWDGPWPAEPVTCGMCGGFGAVCMLCETAGGCYCDLADVVVDAWLDAITAALDTIGDPESARRAATGLNGAADLACATLNLREIDMRVIKAPCPACDRRDLWADVASPRPDEWSIVCRSDLCRCAGPRCGCGRPVRWYNRRHRWPATEFHDLARRLGVRLPTTAT
jgi:hypothetical protein